MSHKGCRIKYKMLKQITTTTHIGTASINITGSHGKNETIYINMHQVNNIT